MNNNEELIKRVEQAAREGAKEGAKTGSRGWFGKGVIGCVAGIISKILFPALIMVLVLYFASTFKNPFSRVLDREEAVENHDLTLENQGFLGFTVADFSGAILGKAEQLKNLEVYMQEITDVATITDAGFAKLKIFSKNQIITYHGTAKYVVDLTKLNASHIKMDEESYTITISIPHAVLDPINIPEENIEYGELKKGTLAFGKIKLTPEDAGAVRAEAIKKMKKGLEDENVIEEADRFALLSVLELYQPVIKSVSKKYSLEVVFDE